MQTGDDRDHIVDRSLRASMPGALTPAGADCLDAEQLAAWQDGGLDAMSVRQVEDHISTCARCQAMAAAFVRADVASSVPATSPWLLRWLMPAVATVAAALTIWILVPRSPAVQPEVQMAMRQPTAPVPAPPPPAAVAPDEVELTRVDGGGASSARSKTVPPAPATDALRVQRGAAERQEAAGALSRSVPPPPAAPIDARRDLPPNPPPAAVAQEPLRQVKEAVAAPSAPAPPPPAPLPPPPTATMNETVAVAAESPVFDLKAFADARTPTVVSEFVSSSLPAAGGAVGAAGRGGRGGGRGVANSSVAGAVAAPPAPPVRWRIFTDGRVERSITNGSSWETIPLDSSWRVATGTAPSSLVCWLVGTGGVVLRTTDGLHFARLPFPEATDLTAVQAASDRAATVTARDGRMFATEDGGATWRALNR